MTKFQILLLAVFVVFIAIGVAVFALKKNSNSSNQLPAIEVWGTMSSELFNLFMSKVTTTLQQPLTINYVEKTAADFNKDFVETLARGGGPDAILIPQEVLLKNQDKLIAIPYDTIPKRSFMDTYVEQAELYLGNNGVLGLPFSIDPLVMYWNKDSFTNAGIATYPRFWDELVKNQKALTQRDDNSNIRKTALALGEFQNVSNAREVFGTLLLQAGNPVTKIDANTGGSVSVLKEAGTAKALEFFTTFSDPTNESYSWNRSLPTSKNYFLSGNLATYFGFASELADIRTKNPNLDFDIAGFPQIRKGNVRTTYGKMYGFSIARSTTDAASTFAILSILTSPTSIQAISEVSYLPPVRRDVIAQGTDDPYLSIFYDSALISRSWLDPDSQATSDIFKEMVESLTSGRVTDSTAIKTADDKINILINKVTQ